MIIMKTGMITESRIRHFLLLLLTGSHDLLIFARICLFDIKKGLTTLFRKYLQNWAFPGKKDQTITMIKVLFICHGTL